MRQSIITSLKKLTDEGEVLIQSGFEISSGTASGHSLQVIDWLLKCNSFLLNTYGKESEILSHFKEAYTLRMSVDVLLSLVIDEMKIEESDNSSLSF